MQFAKQSIFFCYAICQTVDFSPANTFVSLNVKFQKKEEKAIDLHQHK